MERELLILRHGKSDWNVNSDDYHRPLKNRGIKSSIKIGKWLAKENLIPDYTISSSATRAISTAELVFDTLGLDASNIQKEKTLYLASLEELISVLAKCPDSMCRVLLVGHNPGLENLLTYLASETPQSIDGKILPTATIARLKMPEDWQPLKRGSAKLLDLVRPSMLTG